MDRGIDCHNADSSHCRPILSHYEALQGPSAPTAPDGLGWRALDQQIGASLADELRMCTQVCAQRWLSCGCVPERYLQ